MTAGKSWRLRNPEKVKEYQRRYREKNREALRERSNNWNKNNLEKTREIQKRYRERNREKIKEVQKISRLKNKYKNCKGDALTLFYDNNGTCDCCGDELVKPCIDHCHKKMVLRGVLCEKCNIGLGFFKDDITRLEKAIEYLKG